jgi:hypothetical protein
LECFAFIARAEDAPKRALLLLGAADSIREEVDAVMTDYEREEYEREVKLLRSKLDQRNLKTGGKKVAGCRSKRQSSWQ